MTDVSTRNKTIKISDNDKIQLTNKLTYASGIMTKEQIIDKTFHADMFDIIGFFPPAVADLIIIDPPYNLNKNWGDFHFKSTNDENYLDYLESWFPRIVKLLKPNGSLYLCGDWKCTSSLYRIADKYLTVQNRITWQREKGRGAKANWKNCAEDIWFATNSNDYYFDLEAVKIKRKVLAPYKKNAQPKDWQACENGNFRTTCPANFWDDITIPYWSMPENTTHPTQKPEKLLAKLILASCPLGGLVFDPFLGSGTTSVVAKKLNRNYCGIEMNEEYCLISEKRLEMANKNRRIQGYSDGIFWERNSLQFQNKKLKKQNSL